MLIPKFALVPRAFRQSPEGMLWMPERYVERGPAAGGAPPDFDNLPGANGMYVDGSTDSLMVGTGTSGVSKRTMVDIESVQAITGVKTFTSPVLNTPTLNTPTLTTPVINGASGLGQVVALTALFTEDATSLTHTATFAIPAGAILLDILVIPQVLWGATTSAGFTGGDAASANGWFTTTNLKATDLVLGERLQASNANNWGGVNGAYLTTAGRFGQQSTNMIGGYCPTAYSVIGVVTVVGPSATTGRTRMIVLYSIGSVVTPVLA